MYYLIKVYINIMYFFIKNDEILIIETHSPSGSNTKALEREFLKHDIKFDVVEYPRKVEKERSLKYKIRVTKFHVFVSKYKIIVNTNGYKKFRCKQILVDYWHGVPIKSMGFMEEEAIQVKKSSRQNMDFLVTGSKIESTLLNSCMYVPFGRHKILGNPRLDFLKDKYDILNYVESNNIKIDANTRIGIFMPTFRHSDSHGVDGIINENIFNFSAFDSIKFENFLISHNIVIVIKMHQLDLKQIKLIKNTISIDSEKLESDNLDLYQLLNSTDFLISDYSSIIYDYTVLEKPIFIVSSDVKSYSEHRGLLYEPLNKLLSVPLINDQNEFQDSLKSLIDQTYKVDFDKNAIHQLTENNAKRSVEWFLKELLVTGR